MENLDHADLKFSRHEDHVLKFALFEDCLSIVVADPLNGMDLDLEEARLLRDFLVKNLR